MGHDVLHSTRVARRQCISVETHTHRMFSSIPLAKREADRNRILSSQEPDQVVWGSEQVLKS